MTNFSTINPAVPIQGSKLASAPIRANFAAAAADINAIYQILQAVGYKPTFTTIASGSTYVVQPTDQVLLVKKTNGSATAISYTPGTSIIGRVKIVDAKGDAFVNNITITPTSGLINNQAFFKINQNNASVEFLDDGINLWV